MESHEREFNVTKNQSTHASGAVPDTGNVLKAGHLPLDLILISAAIVAVAFVISRLLVGSDQRVQLALCSDMAIQHLLLYYGIGYWSLPRLLAHPRITWFVMGLFPVFWFSYLTNCFVIFSIQPVQVESAQYIYRMRMFIEAGGVFGCFTTLRLFLWNFVFSYLSPIMFLSIKFLNDSSTYRQQQYLLQRNRLLLEQDNALLKLNFLRSQVSPHFLFNTLNAIYSRVVTSNEPAADLVLRLAELMRYNLYEADTSRVSIDRELEFIRSYVILEKARHGEQLSVQIDTDDFFHHQIAPLLLIPFVENAFKHGVKSGTKGAYVNIRAIRQRNDLLFTVENSISQGPTVIKMRKSGGIGLPNVQKRLMLLYPDRHSLSQESTADCYRVSLRITLDYQASVPN